MGARYPFYLPADSKEGQAKGAEVTCAPVSNQPTHGNIRHGFVYGRVRSNTSGSIANNAEIDVTWEKFQQQLESLRDKLNAMLKKRWEEWVIPAYCPATSITTTRPSRGPRLEKGPGILPSKNPHSGVPAPFAVRPPSWFVAIAATIPFPLPKISIDAADPNSDMRYSSRLRA